jgi:hypothetical protein
MDPATTGLVSAVMGVLMHYVQKGAQEFASLAGEAAFQKAKALVEAVRERFAGDGEAAAALKNLEQQPERYAPVVEEILEEKLAADAGFAQDLKAKLDQMEPGLVLIQRIRETDSVLGLEAGEIRSSKPSITQDIEKGRGITGAKIDRLG